MSMPAALGLFQGFGIEIEYMIVDAVTFAVRPFCDRLLRQVAGRIVADVDAGALAWSNELVLHVVELKTNGPVADLNRLHLPFQADVQRINELLRPWGACLMSAGMHPFMNPATDTHLWPHEGAEIYGAFDRIFGCQGHGWSNLQSVHLNLPFQGDEEFARLHAAIRIVLPLLPALAASSPWQDGRISGFMDTRLEVYRHNSVRLPEASGQVIPEPAYSQSEYQRLILEPLYAAVAPLDPDGLLQHEWLNARGAIARFDRNAIEIRLLDTQECPVADAAVLGAVAAVVQGLAGGGRAEQERLRRWPVEPLAGLLRATIRDAERAVIDDAGYLDLLDCGPASLSAGDLWRHLVQRFPPLNRDDEAASTALQVILAEGPLARRLLSWFGPQVDDAQLRQICARLAGALARGEMLRAAR